MIKPIRFSSLSPEQIDELSQLCRTTGDVRPRTRAQITLLAVEQGMSAPAIAEVARESDQTVRNWLKRYEREGIERLKDAPQPGSPNQVTLEYPAQMVEVLRRRPSSLGLSFSLLILVRLADYITEKTGIRVSGQAVRRYLKETEFDLSRPQHKISSRTQGTWPKKNDRGNPRWPEHMRSLLLCRSGQSVTHPAGYVGP